MAKGLDTESIQVYLTGDLLKQFLRFVKANPGMSRSKAAALLIDQGLCLQCNYNSVPPKRSEVVRGRARYEGRGEPMEYELEDDEG